FPESKSAALHASGLQLIEEGRFSPWELPPDWLVVRKDGSLGLSEEKNFEAAFSYNAIRVPLYLYWDGQRQPPLFSPYQALITKNERLAEIPATILLPGGEAGPHPVLPGMAAIYRLVRE